MLIVRFIYLKKSQQLYFLIVNIIKIKKIKSRFGYGIEDEKVYNLVSDDNNGSDVCRFALCADNVHEEYGAYA